MSEYTQKKIIAWTFALVLCLGIIELKMFLMPPTTVAKAIAMAQRSRMPAGFKKTNSNVVLDVADEILDFKLPCRRKISQIDAGGSRQLRFHYETCPHEDDDYKITSIINETNSYQATIFNLDEERQTSDFIPLKEGQNHFKIILTNSDHQSSEQEYVFTRAIAKSQAH